MKSWNEVLIPDLNLQKYIPKVLNSVTLELEELRVADEVTMYVCGITPYDATHMGHAATYVAFDTLNRLWRACGAGVNYVQNVTDIDDPLIERAKKTGLDWHDIALSQTQLFRTDMQALRVIPPAHYVGVIESMNLIVEQIEILKNRNSVYELEGDLYYDITKSKCHGEIAHLSYDEMLEIFAERGGDPNRPGKHNPFDALLWKAKKPNDPSWQTSLGEGRPGWHIECAAISLKYLGTTIDVQGGGSDLKFPHHEMSAAHAESASLKKFARVFMHTGMVALNGEKMSKSLGNLVFVSKLITQGFDPMAIRLTILNNHYRSDWEWLEKDLVFATNRLAQWRAAFRSTTGAKDISKQIMTELTKDLNTPAVLELIDEWAQRTNSGDQSSPTSPSIMAALSDALLGIH